MHLPLLSAADPGLIGAAGGAGGHTQRVGGGPGVEPEQAGHAGRSSKAAVDAAGAKAARRGAFGKSLADGAHGFIARNQRSDHLTARAAQLLGYRQHRRRHNDPGMRQPREIHIVLRARMHQGGIDKGRRLGRRRTSADQQTGTGHRALLVQTLGIAWGDQQILSGQSYA